MTRQPEPDLPAQAPTPPAPAESGFLRRTAGRLVRRFGRSHQQKQIDELTRLVRKVLANQKTLTTRVDNSQQRKQIRLLTGRVEDLRVNQKADQKWRVIFRNQLTALLRNLYVMGSDVPAPHGLSGRRFRLRSQNEEDGIILALLQATGVGTRRFVEIGCGQSGGNAAALAYEFGWGGLMVDASEKAIEKVTVLLRANPGVTAVRAMVQPDTINDLLRSHGMTGEVDLLSIDVDSIDYWLLEALTVCSPRVLVMEYNALFGPERAVTLPCAPLPEDAPKGYSGTSLVAIERLAARKGYRLVLCEAAGINAFLFATIWRLTSPG